MKTESIEPDWRWASPEGSRELDRLLDRRLTFREIVQWQEEAETLSLRLAAARAGGQPNQAGMQGIVL